jgi:hypothetical protein
LILAFEVEVEIKARQFCFLGFFPRALAKGDKAKSGRQHQSLLRAGDQRIDAPLIERQRNHSDRRHTIHKK